MVPIEHEPERAKSERPLEAFATSSAPLPSDLWQLDPKFGDRYPLLVDQAERDEITAAVLTNRQLGPEFDDGVAANLVERIGAEVDRRVDARLAAGPAQSSPSRPIWARLTLGLGSILAGLGVSGIVLNGGASIGSSGIVTHAPSSGQVGLDALVWLVIGAINVAFLRRH